MDYEKKYNEMVQRARELHDAGNALTIQQMEIVCPELAESEDERIRKWIIEELEITRDAMSGKNPYSDDPDIVARLKRLDEAIAYLEKQKDAFENGRQLGIMQEQARQELEWPDKKQKEQKPDIELLQRSWYMEGYRDGNFGNEPKWIVKTGKGGPRYEDNPKYGQLLKKQKPVEWSEEDKWKVSALLAMLTTMRQLNSNGSLVGVYSKRDREKIFDEIENWLKSLRPSWKPSKEQMEALMNGLRILPEGENNDILLSLYQQLKKL